MQELTALVYHYRNTHAVDARLQKIEALSKILDYLKQCNVIGDAGPYGYLLIQDVWDYFPTVSRRFGYRFRLGSGINYQYQSSRSTIKRESNGVTTYHSYGHSRSQTTQPYLTAIAELAHPLGLRWQVDLLTQWKYFIKPENWGKSFSIQYIPLRELGTAARFYSCEADQTLQFSGLCCYIIDSRSNAKMSFTYDLNHYNSRTQYEQFSSGEARFSEQSYDYFGSAFTAALELEYRINIPTILTVRLQYSDTDNEMRDNLREEDDSRYYQLRAEISHYLF